MCPSSTQSRVLSPPPPPPKLHLLGLTEVCRLWSLGPEAAWAKGAVLAPLCAFGIGPRGEASLQATRPAVGEASLGGAAGLSQVGSFWAQEHGALSRRCTGCPRPRPPCLSADKEEAEGPRLPPGAGLLASSLLGATFGSCLEREHRNVEDGFSRDVRDSCSPAALALASLALSSSLRLLLGPAVLLPPPPPASRSPQRGGGQWAEKTPGWAPQSQGLHWRRWDVPSVYHPPHAVGSTYDDFLKLDSFPQEVGTRQILLHGTGD